MVDWSLCFTPAAFLKLEPLKQTSKVCNKSQKKKKTHQNMYMKTGAYFANKAEMKV